MTNIQKTLAAVLLTSFLGGVCTPVFASSHDTSKDKPPYVQEQVKDNPAKDNPAKDNPAKDNPAKDNPAKDNPAKDNPYVDNRNN